MVFVLILSGVLLFITLIYLLVAHYVLAIEIGETIKNTPPDVKLIDITTLQFPKEMEYDDEYHKPNYKK
jgi:hypothetical protein